MNREVRIPLAVIGTVLAIAAVSTVVVTALVEPATYEPGSPEAVVQGFVQATFDGDADRALSYIDPDLRCRRLNLEGATDRATSARIDDVSTTGTTARIVVAFRAEEPLGPGWDHHETFELGRSDGTWWIETTTWFWEPCMR